LTTVPAAARATDPVLKDRVGRLIHFLKDLVTARAVPVRQIEEHLDHLWLVDVQDLAALEPDVAPGGVLLRLPRVFLDAPPALPPVLHGWVRVTDRDNSSLAAPTLRASVAEAGTVVPLAARPAVQSAYQRWLPTWQRWADADRPKRHLQLTYDRLRDMRQRMLENPETVEAVVAGGLLQAPRDGVRTHLLTHRVTIDIEQETGDVVVVLDPAAVTALEDNRVLTGLASFDDGGAAVLRNRIAELDVRPSSGDVLTFLKEWAGRALLQSVDVGSEWSVPTARQVSLTPTPAIVLRRRGAYALQEYYTHIERTLAADGAAVPLGLAQLVESIEAEDRIAWLEATGATAAVDVADDPLFPLPANEEQAQIIGRLRNDTGVVVEGPPGTGKTHTIANLTSALLARGQRVLVTSEKAQALKVLRDKLPPEMQDLCVSITDAGRGGSLELSRSVSRLASEHSSFNPQRAQREIDDLAGRLEQARRSRAATLEEVRTLRESETHEHPEIAPGYRGTLARIAEQVVVHRPDHGWMPVPAVGTLPLTRAELEELRQLLPGDTDERRRRREQVLPPTTAVPDLRLVERLAKDVARGSEARTRQSGPLSEVLGELDAPTLGALIQVCGELRDGLADLAGGSDASWALPVLESVLRGDDEVLWTQVGNARQLVTDALAMNEEIGFRQVDVTTDVAPAAAGSSFESLARYLDSGGALKKLFKSEEQKSAEPFLGVVTIDGQPVTAAEQAHVAALHFLALARLQAFAGRAALLSIPSGTVGPRAAQVSYADRVVRTIDAIGLLDQARRRLGSVLARVPAMPRVDLGTTQGVHSFIEVAAVFADVEVARRASDQLDSLAAALESSVEKPHRAPELLALVTALHGADGNGYARGVDALDVARREQRTQARCDELSARLHAGAPALLTQLRDSASDEDWDRRLPDVQRAWDWARAATFVRERTTPGREVELDRDLAGVDRDLAKLTAQLAAAQAWKSCLQRMTAGQVTALQAYRDNMANVGKGTGKYAQRYRLAARDAMTAAQEAVPAWVMPLQEVLASIPPHQNAFDVVIVDEASQVGIENLFLLWLAPRVIVVGDDKQCTPSEVKHGALDKIFERLDTLLPDMPSYMRATLTPRSSVFSTMRTRFGQVIRLREHFRCMPEIITWSSQMFYGDAPLVPMRQHGADRLQPLRTTYVPAAFTEGQDAQLHNVVEAEAIVDAVVGCLEDSAYDDRTLGVVVLQGRAQVDLIREALFRRVDPETWERRKIRIGTPPDFQGDERHVVFLSLVTAPNHQRASQTRLDAQRAYNVAASRAQDQLWLFHSVTSDQLRPDDLRSQLLTYMTSVPVAAAAAMPDDVSDDERHPSFDSLFEQRVFRRIQQRGYHVTPQVEVNGRRIDLVITGSQGKLAVECDGDTWQSSPEQVASDFARELELRRCGWHFWRVRESWYLLDPEAALADLWLVLDNRGITTTRIEGAVAESDWRPGALSAEEGGEDLDLDPGPSSPPRSAPTSVVESSAPPAAGSTAAFEAEVDVMRTVPDVVRPPAPDLAEHPRTPQGAQGQGGSGELLDQSERSVLELAVDAAVTNEAVRGLLGVDRDEARRILAGLTHMGLLERRGAKRGTHYVLTGPAVGSGQDGPSPTSIDHPPQGIGMPPVVDEERRVTEPAPSPRGGAEAAFAARVHSDADAIEGLLNDWYVDKLVELGALELARHLLARSEPLRLIRRLARQGLLEHCIETAVVDPEFRDLFSSAEIRTARQRLEEVIEPGVG
jgi:very-short-patch-repair endonuclease